MRSMAQQNIQFQVIDQRLQILETIPQQLIQIQGQLQGMNAQIQGQFQGMNAQIQGIVQDQQNNAQIMQQMLQVQQNILVTFATNQTVTADEKNKLCRQWNSKAKYDNGGQLHALVNGQGQVSPNFPLSRRQLLALTSIQINSNLAFYALPMEGNKAERLDRLCIFIGV